MRGDEITGVREGWGVAGMKRRDCMVVRVLMGLWCVFSMGCVAPQTKAPVKMDQPGVTPESGMIVSGGSHSCMIRPDKTAACWGDNRYGQLGDGTTADSTAPVEVRHLSYVVGLAAGEWHTCAVLATGQVKCWGDNASWQLGVTSPRRSSKPVLTGVGPATQVAAGRLHSCAILIQGEVTCWGDNRAGQTGVQRGPAVKPTLPVMVPNVVHAIAVAAGDQQTCAVQQDGQVLCWGDNQFSQVGGTSDRRISLPRPVPLAGKAQSVAVGRHHACALLEDRTVQCWGDGAEGELGDGLSKDSLTPVKVAAPEPAGETAPLEHVAAITAGSQHTCALLEDGRVYCWGSNALGQMGRVEGKMALRPVFTGLTDVVAVAAGGWHTCALRSGGVTTCVGVMAPKDVDVSDK
jgi:alpha-tubulin suppressor-like RCC1 family protein